MSKATRLVQTLLVFGLVSLVDGAILKIPVDKLEEKPKTKYLGEPVDFMGIEAFNGRIVLEFCETIFMGEIGIGQPLQEFDVLFDTGSSNLWVFDTSCTVSSCDGHNLFNQTQSTSFVDLHEELFLEYGTGGTFISA